MGSKMTKTQDRLTLEEELELNSLMNKYKNDDKYFAHMNCKVTTFMLLGGVRSIKGRPTPEEMLLALLVSGRY
tara:strand:+ start:27 stop:245 length:219 start_codon:yes stop_codon:yes gene_type:complete